MTISGAVLSPLQLNPACGINYASVIHSRELYYNFQAMIRLRWTLFLLLTLLLVAAVLISSYRVLRETDLSVRAIFRPPPADRILITMEGFRLVQSENGRPAWVVKAGTADFYENKEARLRNIEMVFNDPDGRTAALIGEQGSLDTASGNAAIRRGTREVRIVTSDGYLMTTSSLAWNAADRSVRTRDPFKVLGKEIYFEGKGMSAHVDMRQVAVESDVKAVLQE